MHHPTATRQPCTPTYGDGSPFRTRHAAVYRLDPPLSVERESGDLDITEFVIVSTTETSSGVETNAFASDSRGVLLSWEEIDGRAGCDEHAVVLTTMGYPYIDGAQPRELEQ